MSTGRMDPSRSDTIHRVPCPASSGRTSTAARTPSPSASSSPAPIASSTPSDPSAAVAVRTGDGVVDEEQPHEGPEFTALRTRTPHRHGFAPSECGVDIVAEQFEDAVGVVTVGEKASRSRGATVCSPSTGPAGASLTDRGRV